MNLEEKQLNCSYIYKGRIINLRKDTALLPDGSTAEREVIEHPGGVCVVAINKNKEIYLVTQYRYPYSELLLEIPAGKRDKPNESPLNAAMRELKEETGCTAGRYYDLGKFYPTPGYVNEVIYMFAAADITEGKSNPDDDEFIECTKMPIVTAVEKIMAGEITDGKTIAAVLKVKCLLESRKIEI